MDKWDVILCYVQLWVCSCTSRWGNMDVLNRDWNLYLKTTANFVENLCEWKMQKGMKFTCEYLLVFLVPFLVSFKTSWISRIKSSRKAQSVQCCLVNILHFDAKEKRRGNHQYKNSFIGNLYQHLKSLPLSPIFSELPQLMQPTPWILKLEKNWWTNANICETHLKTVLLLSFGLYSAWCLPWVDNFCVL